ncbi:hypothetical protein HYQ46_004095 [Verticillium longisporum]|nr:hypothetical protein HYQ46_004095 [Verticillium longisporum]
MGVEARDGAKELVEGVEVELVGKDLGDDLEEVLLRQDIAALHNLLEQGRQDARLVRLEVDELAQAHNVAADEQLQLLALPRPLLPLARVALVLEAHPQLVHLDKVGEDKVDRVGEVAFGAVAVAAP